MLDAGDVSNARNNALMLNICTKALQYIQKNRPLQLHTKPSIQQAIRSRSQSC